ncbi:helix-turn-helix transcriptional regulator [Streptosporangium sp. NBC_01495]|uniref:helix-turn-helix transcriptional regulator n=1 Tax=Streptosporangium sp. NBC_01495 TaxID=2903899 RepID=UPI002E30BB85|nr:helix-turn-helix transcriptional regulator [Streptosporangium sp. NBC_01495]
MRESSLRRLLSALRECEQAAPGEDLFPRMLSALSAVVDTDVIAYKTLDLRAGQVEQHPWPPVALPADLVRNFTRLFAEHPFLSPLGWPGGHDGPLRLSDLVTRRQWHSLDLYHEFYRPLGIEYQMMGVLGIQHGVLTGIGLNRVDGDFTDTDLQLLEVASPHLSALLRAARATAWLESALAALDALDDTAHGVLLLGPHATAMAANRIARVLLAAHFPRHTRDGGPLPEEIAAWLAAHRRTPDPGEPPVPDYVAEHDGRSLTIRLVPYRSHGALLLTESTPRLSVRESDVLRLVAGGRTSEGIARTLEISPRTVEKHLANIYAKLGVTNRTEAAMRVFGRNP